IDSESDSDSHTRVLRNRVVKNKRIFAASSPNMDPEQLRTVVEAAIRNALAEQAVVHDCEQQALIQTINDLSNQVAAVLITPPVVQQYTAVEIRNDVRCDEPLDAVKCLQEFAGAQES
ncbi:hypothetical protein KR018_006307, partial [Drosophila ironensis]